MWIGVGVCEEGPQRLSHADHAFIEQAVGRIDAEAQRGSGVGSLQPSSDRIELGVGIRVQNVARGVGFDSVCQDREAGLAAEAARAVADPEKGAGRLAGGRVRLEGGGERWRLLVNGVEVARYRRGMELDAIRRILAEPDKPVCAKTILGESASKGKVRSLQARFSDLRRLGLLYSPKRGQVALAKHFTPV
jgi:hypothetical protein